jgi:hypothetical protein
MEEGGVATDEHQLLRCGFAKEGVSCFLLYRNQNKVVEPFVLFMRFFTSILAEVFAPFRDLEK